MDTYTKCQGCGKEIRSFNCWCDDCTKAENDKLLVELVEVLYAYEGNKELVSNQGQALDGFSALANFVNIARKARELCKQQ